jgi:tetratricopeptide (TPR) repeat protein
MLNLAYRHLPYKSDVAGLLALASYRLGHFEPALSAALVHLAINSSAAEDGISPSELVLRIAKRLPSERAEAIVSAGEAAQSFPRTTTYHLAMGQVFDELGLDAMALTEYQRALALKPQSARAIFLIGLKLELHYHNYEDALKNYIDANRIDPADQEIAAHLRRLKNRMKLRSTDFAWQLKDRLHSLNK